MATIPIGGKSSVAFVSDYIPRQCGIATFTHDLCEAVAKAGGEDCEVFVVAMNDVPEGYSYPQRVRFEVRQSVQADYRLAAEFLNVHQVGAVCLQHEYGIFGGTCGSHILAMLRRLRRPLVTTLHTVLKEPDDQQQLALQEVGKLADRMVVMSEMAQAFLHDIYDVPREKIVVIPHGIPDVPFIDPHFYKDQFDVEGRKVMLTFGLLSPGKGIEYAIEALPKIVARHPDVVYIVLGATHPHVKRKSGEEYRNSLLRLADNLGVEENLIMVNRFVELSELCEFLGATDIYVTPYPNEAQITSGTLAYALGAGKATVSTPYWHAQELLADGRGRLVPFNDSDAIAEQVIDLLDNEPQRHAMRKLCYTYCRDMVWPKVGQAYLNLFAEAGEAFVARRQEVAAAVAATRAKEHRRDELPEMDLRHLRILTDDTGILQHCRYSTPHRDHGYCTDDNARALIAMGMYWDQTRDEAAIPLIQRYLSFLSHAMDEKTGRFRNFMNYDRTWSEMSDSEDSHARGLPARVDDHTGDEVVHPGAGRDGEILLSAGVGVYDCGHSRVSAAVRRRQRGAAIPRQSDGEDCSVVPRQCLRRLAMVRGCGHVCQRQVAPRDTDERKVDEPGRLDRHGQAGSPVAAGQPDQRGRGAVSDRNRRVDDPRGAQGSLRSAAYRGARAG